MQRYGNPRMQMISENSILSLCSLCLPVPMMGAMKSGLVAPEEKNQKLHNGQWRCGMRHIEDREGIKFRFIASLGLL